MPNIQKEITEVYGEGFWDCPYDEIYINPNDCNPIKPSENSLRINPKIFLLINEKTYSAAVEFAVIMKDNNIGTLLGTETGQNASGDGCLYCFDLPKTHLYCWASTTLSVRPNGDVDFTHGIIPDFEVKNGNNVIHNDQDYVLDFTINLIEQGKNN